MDDKPTVFHITHWKAGSQWVAAVLKECAPKRYVTPKVGIAQFLQDPLKPGHVYPTVYVARPAFDQVMQRSGWTREQQRETVRTFVVMRDLRDTLISFYYSIKVSHAMLTDKQAALRKYIQDNTVEDGLIRMNTGVIRQVARIQTTWLNDEDVLHIRYEDLIADEQAAFERIIDHCQIDVSRSQRHKMVERNSFERVSGRKPGQEEVTAHHRKGIAGDWQNHFTDRVKEEFKRNHGQVLIETGYESDLNW